MPTMQTIRKLDFNSNGAHMTAEEFDAVKEFDEEYVYELVNGVLIVTLYPSAEERGPNDELGHLFLTYRDQNPNGYLIDGTLNEEYLRYGQTRRRADRVIWTGLGRAPNIKSDIPSIVVEFVSAGKQDRLRDYVVKRDEYREIGVKEYWVIDRFRKIMTVYYGNGSVKEIKGKGVYRTALLPGFEVPIQRLFAAAATWKKSE
jgi:Uma2 family endonuclease